MNWITSNPAKAAGIYDQTGSLKVGKNADVVIWSKNPFSVYALAETVFIDGGLAYDRKSGFYPSSDFDVGIINSNKNRLEVEDVYKIFKTFLCFFYIVALYSETILIKNATIYDGVKNIPFEGNILIENETINKFLQLICKQIL